MRHATPLWLAVAFTVLGACATAAPTGPPEVDVTGRWAGPWISIGSLDRGEVDLTLSQKEGRVTGDLRLSATRLRLDGPVAGTVSGRTLRFHQPGGSMSGDLTAHGETLKGTVYGGVLPRTFELTRQR